MTLPKEGSSVTIIINLQDNTSKLGKLFAWGKKKMLRYAFFFYILTSR